MRPLARPPRLARRSPPAAEATAGMRPSVAAMRLAASAVRRRSGGAIETVLWRRPSTSSTPSSSLLPRFRGAAAPPSAAPPASPPPPPPPSSSSSSSPSPYDPLWPAPGADPARIVLGIESSCDDTGAAVVRGDGRVLGQALATQAEIHAPFGGVVPKLAMEAHQRAIDGTVERALREAKISIEQVDAVAVSSGPGLSLCLRVGGGKAAALAREANLPLVQVHHLEAHALVARLKKQGEGEEEKDSSSPSSPPPPPSFPFVCVLASGGHNLLLLVRGVGDYSILGTTLDDALGEAFDKVARMLGLDPTPSGGAAVENAAAGKFGSGSSSSVSLPAPGDPRAFEFARPLKNRRNSANVSYAGLKTAVRMAAERTLPELLLPSEGEGKRGDEKSLALLRKAQADLAASFQRVAIEHLAEKAALALGLALEREPDCSALVLTGGVARNRQLRREMERVAAGAGLPLVAPPPELCTDNGVMVAWAAHERLDAGVARLPRPEGMPDPAPEGWVDCRPRWPLAATTREFREELGGSARWVKSARLHESLTELTAEVLLLRGREGRESERNSPSAVAEESAV